MAKYFDLLRQHQNNAEKPSASATKTADHSESGELEKMIADESEIDGNEYSPSDTFSSNPLLADEEEYSYAETTAKPSPEAITPTRTTPLGYDANISSWLTVCSQQMTKLFKSASTNSSGDFNSVIYELDTLLQRLDKDERLIDVLELEIATRIKQIRALDDDLGGLILKSIMMMLYAIKVGGRLKLNRDELRSFILAAMVHHIGMAQISGDIRHKKEKLSKDEVEEIRTAPVKSHDYIGANGVTDAAILLAASQAQERFDGSGPQGLSGLDIAYSARIIGLLSMFEALIHYRPYRNRLLPRDAIRELVNHYKQGFDPRLLKVLIESISLYPVGTFVQLNSGDIGQVIQVNPRLPLRPLIRMMFDSHGDAISPREINLQKQPNLMVQRCMYEEGLQELKDSSAQGDR